MTVDPIWERIHATREWGKYPPEELVRFAATRFGPRHAGSRARILDLGCGIGAATWLLAREGFSAVAIDASPSAIARLVDRLRSEGLAAETYVGDVVTCLPDLFEPRSFDGVVEIACLCTLPRADARRVVENVARLLKAGGRLFSMTFDVNTWGYGLGTEIEPDGFTDIPEGPFVDRGFTRFCAEPELEELYRPLKIVSVEALVRSVGGRCRSIAYWVVECEQGAD